MLLLDMLELLLVLLVPPFTFWVVEPRFGEFSGTVAAVVSCVLTLVLYTLNKTRKLRYIEKMRCVLTNKYPDIYRVVELPTDFSDVITADGAEIVIGDYGWEAEPINPDDRVYLHGLTGTWCVVWYAGFRPDQIEKIGPKPRTQYYLPHIRLVLGKLEAVTCPFPIQSRETLNLGFPVQIIGN